MNVVDLGISFIAGLFLLLGLALLLWRGALGHNGVDKLYSVGKQEHRRVRQKAMVQGLGLILVGAFLLAIFRIALPAVQQAMAEAEPTPLPIATIFPTPTPLPTAVIEPTATPIVETATPLPTETATPIPPTPTPSNTPTPSVTPTITPIPTGARVNIIGGLNLRATPNGEVVELVDDATPLILLDGYQTVGGYNWREVELPNGLTGWVADKFIAYNYPP